jgi:hypothetical protein
MQFVMTEKTFRKAYNFGGYEYGGILYRIISQGILSRRNRTTFRKHQKLDNGESDSI